MSDLNTSVLIVGGGAVGLSTSIFLSNLGVDHILVERHAGTSLLPKAHYLNQRTMEIFRQHGVAESIYAQGAKVEDFATVRWVTSLGGDGPFDRVVVAEMDSFGGGSLAEQYSADSPVPATNLPLIRMEPVLRSEAEKRAGDAIRFHHELVKWTDNDSGVIAVVRNRDDGEQYTIRARYMVAADGGKTIGPRLGAVMEGPTNMALLVSVHFSADLSEYVNDSSLVTWLIDPDGVNPCGLHALAKMGPTWDRHSEEWSVHLARRPDDSEFDSQTILPRVRELLKLPDTLPIEVHNISRWVLDRVVAETWRFGSVFLAGDASHRQPPTSGLGLNTGIHDAHNIAWKLAQVLSGRAVDRLLDSYVSERKPVSTASADWAMLTHANTQLFDLAHGLTIGAPVEVNRAAFAALMSDTPMGRTLRARAARVVSTQTMEFQAHDVEIGFYYEDGALVPDGSDQPLRDPLGSIFTPVARPGSRVPHAWLDKAGQRVSTHDLTGVGDFVLITGVESEQWVTAAQAVTDKTGLEVKLVRVDSAGSTDYADSTGRWSQLSELEPDGALLVRPDNHIAWRSRRAPAEHTQALMAAILAVLEPSDASTSTALM